MTGGKVEALPKYGIDAPVSKLEQLGELITPDATYFTAPHGIEPVEHRNHIISQGKEKNLIHIPNSTNEMQLSQCPQQAFWMR